MRNDATRIEFGAALRMLIGGLAGLVTPQPSNAEIEAGFQKLWAVVFATALAVWAMLFLLGFRVAAAPFVAALVALPVIGQVVRAFRARTRLQTVPYLLEAGLVFIYLTLVLTLASFAAAAVAMPLRDEAFVAIDRMLGFDWSAVASAVQQRPSLRAGLRSAYGSIVWQPMALVATLCLAGRIKRVQQFIAAWLAAALISVAMSALWPAQSPFGHWALVPISDTPLSGAVPRALDTFLGLRSGALREVFAFEFEGIVTFPSFHALCGVLFAWAFWAVPYLRWPMLVINVAMIASTPMVGSHYLIDVVIGVVLAPVAIRLGSALLGTAHRTQ